MSETEDMVERVARAIASSEGIPYVGTWRQFEPAARAAIAAMREPTEAMVEAAPGRSAPEGSMYHGIWRAMIDAALSPTP